MDKDHCSATTNQQPEVRRKCFFSVFGSGPITGSAYSKSQEVDLEVIPVDPEVEVEVEAGFACLTSGYP